MKLKIITTFGEIEEFNAAIGAARVHGYENGDGSWALSRSDTFPIPCTWVQIKHGRQRKWRWIMKSRIVEGFPK